MGILQQCTQFVPPETSIKKLKRRIAAFLKDILHHGDVPPQIYNNEHALMHQRRIPQKKKEGADRISSRTAIAGRMHPKLPALGYQYLH
jgi:hypothetical protein